MSRGSKSRAKSKQNDSPPKSKPKSKSKSKSKAKSKAKSDSAPSTSTRRSRKKNADFASNPPAPKKKRGRESQWPPDELAYLEEQFLLYEGIKGKKGEFWNVFFPAFDAKFGARYKEKNKAMPSVCLLIQFHPRLLTHKSYSTIQQRVGFIIIILPRRKPAPPVGNLT